MGTTGYRRALDVDYPPGAIILEVGFERDAGPGGGSTTFLAGVGPPVHVVDVDPAQVARARALPNVVAHHGLAEDVLPGLLDPPSAGLLGSPPVVGFAWLDGHDWPYAHAAPGTWDAQEAEYLARGQAYSREASATSHLVIAALVEPRVPVGGVVACDDTWATPSPLDDDPGPGWSGKGGRAVPHLLARGFEVLESGDVYHGLVVLRRVARPAD